MDSPPKNGIRAMMDNDMIDMVDIDTEENRAMIDIDTAEYRNYKQQLYDKIEELNQELKHRKERLEYNLLAEVCKKAILAQRKVIFNLELQIQLLKYRYQHDL